MEIIFAALEAHRSDESGCEEAPTVNLRTEEGSRRVKRVIDAVITVYRNEDHCELLNSLMNNRIPAQDREIVLFWHLALNNRLFREISTRVFAKAYLAGRGGLRKDDIVGYVKDFRGNNEPLGLDWSETIIDRLGSRYLNFMSKLNLISEGRNKSFHPIRLSGEALTVFLYLSRIHQPERRNILTHELFPLCFISPDDLVARLKKISNLGAFMMDFNGVALNIDLVLPYRELPNVLYSRQST